YIAKSFARVAKSRANNPGHATRTARERAHRALENNKFHCDVCNLSFSSRHSLQDHHKRPKHLRKSQQPTNPFVCKPCDLGFHNKSNLTRHEKSERHAKQVQLLAGQTFILLEKGASA
ncbi:hypothetical protein M440DRAFT_1328628, partial [Trichoderma longibrachiatum ATCC 18648]